MSTSEPVYANFVHFMESRKRKSDRVPLPYLIRPRRQLPLYDSLCIYNDYVESSSINDENDEDDDLPMEAVETSTLEKNLQNENNASLSELGESSDQSLSDEEYVLVGSSSKTEKAGAIQMMEISKDIPVSPLPCDGVLEKDTVVESESKDAGSDNDDWVVV